MLLLSSGETFDLSNRSSLTVREKRTDAAPLARVQWLPNLSITLFPPADSVQIPKMALSITVHCDPHPRCCLSWSTLEPSPQPPLGFISLVDTTALTFLRDANAVGMLASDRGKLMGVSRDELPGRSVVRTAPPAPLFLDSPAMDLIASPDTFTQPGVVDRLTAIELVDEAEQQLGELTDAPLLFDEGRSAAVLSVRESGELLAQAPGVTAIRNGSGVRLYVLAPSQSGSVRSWCAFECNDGDPRRMKIFGHDLTKRAELSVADEGLLLTSVDGVMKTLN